MSDHDPRLEILHFGKMLQTAVLLPPRMQHFRAPQ